MREREGTIQEWALRPEFPVGVYGELQQEESPIWDSVALKLVFDVASWIEESYYSTGPPQSTRT